LGEAAEIDRLMAEMQLARDFLQSEGERVEQETIRYANLAQAAASTENNIA
jgi:hypothetical protein